MSDVETLLSAYPRIHFACRARHVRDPVGGKVLSARPRVSPTIRCSRAPAGRRATRRFVPRS